MLVLQVKIEGRGNQAALDVQFLSGSVRSQRATNDFKRSSEVLALIFQSKFNGHLSLMLFSGKHNKN